MPAKELILGCDFAAVKLMKVVRKLLEDQAIAYTFIGVEDESDETAYPLIARQVAEAIIASGYQKEGILICGTGIGMSISANKFPGIYAAICHDGYSAERARLSNSTNVLCMGARVIGPEHAKKVLSAWLKTEFQGGRSQAKLDLIRSFEQELYR